eukprot:jgi/Botrbrau1/1935/Bobra.0005s0033.3
MQPPFSWGQGRSRKRKFEMEETSRGCSEVGDSTDGMDCTRSPSPISRGNPSTGDVLMMDTSNDTNFLPVGKDIRLLPQDMLVKMFGSLDMKTLKVGRLVCNTFRAASIPCIHGVTINSGNVANPITPERTGELLAGFTSLTSLQLRVGLPRDAPMLHGPWVLSKLRNLHLWWSWERGPAGEGLGAHAPLLTAATQLTALRIEGPTETMDFGAQLAQVLEACPSVQKLALAGEMWDNQGVAMAILEAPKLSSISINTLWLWDSLLPGISQLTMLQALDDVPLQSLADVEALVPLTRLTRLSLNMNHASSEFAYQQLPPILSTTLNSLSSMQVLHFEGYIFLHHVRNLVGPMRHLHELHFYLYNGDSDAAELDSLLALLPDIVKLDVYDVCYFDRQPEQMVFPGVFCPNGFAALLDLSMTLACVSPDVAAKFTAAVTGLHRMVLWCDRDSCHEITMHLHPMPCLTELSLGSVSGTGPELTYPSGRFLGGFPRLRRLKLRNVLDLWRWDHEVGYITALSELQVLEIHCESNRVAGCLTDAQLQPLTLLKHFEVLKASGLWTIGLTSLQSLGDSQEAQTEMGLPEADVSTSGWTDW